MGKYKIKELVDEISERVDDPKNSGYEIFVGLEHYDSGEVQITRYGSTSKLDSSMKKFVSGDILIARRNVYLKRAGIVNFEGLTSGDSIVLRAKNNTIRKLLPFIFNTSEFWEYATKFSDGTMSKRLSPKLLLDYEVLLPDTEFECELLGETLWSIAETLSSYKKMISLSDELLKVEFIERFSSLKRVKLGDFIEQYRGVSYKPSDLGDCPNSRFTTLLRANNINNNYINYEDLQFVSNTKIQKYQYIKRGDILLCGSSGSKEHVGKAALFIDEGLYTYGAFCKLIRATKDLNPIYIAEYFRSDEYRDYILEIACGANINNLRNEHIDNILIPYPTIDEQNNFISFVLKVNKSKEELQKNYNILKSVYNKLISKKFRV